MSKQQENKENQQTELRAVLIGKQGCGKTSVINTIVDNSESEAEGDEYVKREGFIEGKKVSLVETPSWWKTFNLSDLSNISKLQLVRRISLISPGPHVILIVIRADSAFTETDESFLNKYMELLDLGPNVWTHTLVIFTRGDLIKHKDIEQCIREEGSALKRIIEKCENNYHIFNNSNHHHRTQVKELFNKIEGIVKKSNGKHFDIDLEKVKEVNELWEEIQTRANSRKSRVQKERSIVQEKAHVRRLEDIRAVLLGWVFSGKSSAGNTILNRDEFAIGGKNRECTRGYGNVDGRKISVLDTPGWWKYFTSELNPDFIRSAILESVSECKFPHAMLLVIPADTSFQKEQKRIIEQNMSILGDNIWNHTIVLFTWGDRFKDISIEHHIESEGEALQWLIEKCRNRYHVFDNTDKNNRDQVSELLQKIDEMVAENCLFRPNTQKNCDVETSCQRNDSEEVLNREIRLKDACHFLNAGFKIKAEEIRRKIQNLCAHIMEECLNLEESSMTYHLNFADQDKPNDDPLNEMGTFEQDIPEPIKTLLEREFSRWESVIIDGVEEGLQDIKSFELSQSEKRKKSVDVVERWLQNYNHYVQHTIDKIQDPESAIRTKTLKIY